MMISHLASDIQPHPQLSSIEWIKLSLVTALVSVMSVLAVQALAIARWPEVALFGPLDSYARSALFTLVPVVGATLLLAWLVGKQKQAVQRFITISVIVLLISIIPDYILPVPNRTVLASTVVAFLHVVAALITVFMLVTGYQRRATDGLVHPHVG